MDVSAYAQILGLRQAAVVWRSSFHRSVATTCCNSADTMAGALTPKAIIWNVMQITKIHFVTSAVVATAVQHAHGINPDTRAFFIRAGLEAN